MKTILPRAMGFAVILGVSLPPATVCAKEAEGEKTVADKNVSYDNEAKSLTSSEDEREKSSPLSAASRQSLADALKDNRVRDAINNKLRDQYLSRYSRFFAKLGLDTHKRAQVVDLFVARRIAQASDDSGNSTPAAPKSGASVKEEPPDPELEAIIGADGVKQLRYFNKTAAARRSVDRLQHRLEAEGAHALTDAQREQMVDVLLASKQASEKKHDLKQRLGTVLDPEQVGEYMAILSEQKLAKDVELKYGPLLSLFEAGDGH